MAPPHGSYGRMATLLVLSVLILTVCAAVYVFMARGGLGPSPLTAGPNDADALRQAAAQRMVTVLTILLISALLILLFVIGAYLLIRVGRFVVRERVGGQPTEYIDAWQNYRLTDDEISAATREDQAGAGPGGQPPEPPTDPDSNPPPTGS